MSSATQHLSYVDGNLDIPTDPDSPGFLVDALLQAGDIEGAEAELERLCLEALDSGEPVPMTRQSWEDLRLELHQQANLPS